MKAMVIILLLIMFCIFVALATRYGTALGSWINNRLRQFIFGGH